ncbi:hypothetical protein HanRHA438_Chr04g0195251 [Helianthus annuus]|nr:hypothetical protein HanRHA438_Chr04g0195251 [Helianthus annuus]
MGGSKKLRQVARKLLHPYGSFSFQQPQIDGPIDSSDFQVRLMIFRQPIRLMILMTSWKRLLS